MLGVQVTEQMILPGGLMMTVHTGILDTFMFRLSVSPQITFSCSLIATILSLTDITDVFMFGLSDVRMNGITKNGCFN